MKGYDAPHLGKSKKGLRVFWPASDYHYYQFCSHCTLSRFVFLSEHAIYLLSIYKKKNLPFFSLLFCFFLFLFLALPLFVHFFLSASGVFLSFLFFCKSFFVCAGWILITTHGGIVVRHHSWSRSRSRSRSTTSLNVQANHDVFYLPVAAGR